MKNQVTQKMKQWLFVLAALCLVMSAMPVQTQASTIKGDYRIITLKQKKWVTDKYDGKYFNVYKLKIPSDGYIRLYINRSDLSTARYRNHVGSVAIYTTWNLENTTQLARFYEKTNFFAVSKGTYYVDCNDVVKFKWDFQPMAHGKNTTMAKAEKMSAGKNRSVCFNAGYDQTPKWYKVKLTKSNRIRVFVKPRDWNSLTLKQGGVRGPKVAVFILNSKGKKLNKFFVDRYVEQTSVLPKGTYYIRLERFKEEEKIEKYGSRVISFTWNMR